MASNARASFSKSSKDVDRLLEIHTHLGGKAAGRRTQLAVLNKSAVVLISAIWESYCEDIAAEGLAHLVKYADAGDLPKGIKKIVAKELKEDPHELAIWQLAGDGWETFLSTRLANWQNERNKNLNTPKSPQIRKLFQEALGIDDITKNWFWKGMSIKNACGKLDKYVGMRGDIAHRGTTATACNKPQVKDFLNHVNRLVKKTGGTVNTHVKKVTGKPLWK